MMHQKTELDEAYDVWQSNETDRDKVLNSIRTFLFYLDALNPESTNSMIQRDIDNYCVGIRDLRSRL